MNITKLESQLGPWVIRHRWIILAFSLLLTLAAASGARFLTFENDSRIFFSKDNPQLQAFDAMERTYAKSDNVMFVITDPSGDIFNNETLSAIEWLTTESWMTPFSSRVDSITNFQYTYAEEDEMVVEDMVSDAFQLNLDQISLIKQRVLKEPLLLNRLVAPESETGAGVTAVNITIQKPEQVGNEVTQVAKFVREMGTRFQQRYPNLQLHIGGGLMFNNAFMDASMDDMSSLVPLMYLVLIVVMFWLLRSFTGTLSTFLIIGFSVAVAMGTAGWLGMALSPPSANSPTIILTIAIAHCIHILSTFSIHMRQGESKNEAISESLRINVEPVVLTSITTAIGFLSMNAANAPPFHTLGNIVAIGSIASMLFSLLTLPALISLLPVRQPKQEKGHYHQFMEAFGDFVVRKTRILTYGSIALVVASISGIAAITLDDNFVLYFDDDYEIRQYADYTMDNLTGLDLIEYSLNAGGSGDINEPDYLQKIEEFANWYRQQPKVAHVSVLTDIVKRLNKNMHGDDEQYFKIPEERELAAQYLL
ncbi:MAG: MMPL family transporter, partial [Gammaproteobacteria bacterium]|nr:MMPL family transporter [Gammaproteobacteria bacterium]